MTLSHVETELSVELESVVVLSWMSDRPLAKFLSILRCPRLWKLPHGSLFFFFFAFGHFML